MDAARFAGVPFFLGGEAFPYEAHRRYLQEQIRSREDHLRRFLHHSPLRAIQWLNLHKHNVTFITLLNDLP